jgi:hypothetical protein
MTDTVRFEFYSDTNLGNAYDELQLMALDQLGRDGSYLVVSREDMQAMGDSIEAIVSYNGGELIE